MLGFHYFNEGEAYAKKNPIQARAVDNLLAYYEGILERNPGGERTAWSLAGRAAELFYSPAGDRMAFATPEQIQKTVEQSGFVERTYNHGSWSYLRE